MKQLNFILILSGFFLLGMFFAGCDKPSLPNEVQKSVEKETSEKKIANLVKRAEQGDATAQFALGGLYYYGKEGFISPKIIEFEDIPIEGGPDSPYSRMVRVFQPPPQLKLELIPADENGKPSQPLTQPIFVSVDELKGWSQSKDMAKAAEWWQKSAEQGNVDAQYSLGWMYVTGEGVPKDLVKAIDWYQKAAEQGDTEAQFLLGALYFIGEGVPKDVVKTIEWTQKAAEQGNVDAQPALGEIYYYGYEVPKDFTKAFEWYQKAATQGIAEAQFRLGWMYGAGEGVPKDLVKAAEWYQKAAEQGNATAQNNLGVIYFSGNGFPKDYAKAFEWYQKAATQGIAGAQFRLGWMYGTGNGVPKDAVIAYAWSNLGASGGEKNAAGYRSIAELNMSTDEIAEAQRLSSAWKKGRILTREGQQPVNSSATALLTPRVLSKQGTGTLFLINPTGQAITNHHVVSECDELRIEGRDGLANVVTEDPVNDLALVQIPGVASASAAITSDPGNLRQGEDIVVFGFPLNTVLSSGGNLTPGVVSALTGLGNNTNQIQVTAPIQPGSSGSPVLNKKGFVVGVMSMKLSDMAMAEATGQLGQNVNFAVNGQTVRTFLDAHHVSYRSGRRFFVRDKSLADLGDDARRWTFVIECWK